MLDPTQWRLRGQRLYGISGDRLPLILCRDLTFPLVRVEVDFKGNQGSLRKAGTIQQIFNGIPSGEQTVHFENRYFVFSDELVPYSLQWNPIASLPAGYLRIWEYIGFISDDFLNQLIAYSNGTSMPLYHAPQLPQSTKAISASITEVASSITAVEILAVNSARLGFGVFNLSTSALYLALGEEATSANFTAKLEAGDYYEPPVNFTGLISGIWASANGSAKVTEFT